MSSLNSLASSRRKRAALAAHLLVASAIMVGFAFSPDIGLRVVGVTLSNLYLFAVAMFTLRRVSREADAAAVVSA